MYMLRYGERGNVVERDGSDVGRIVLGLPIDNPTLTHPPSLTHARTHARTRARTHIHIHMHIHTCTCTNAHTNIHTHHTCTHTRKYAHIHRWGLAH